MKRPDRWLMVLKVLKWVFFANAVVFGALALAFAIDTVVFLERSTLTTGTVTALDVHTGDDNVGDTFSPVFSFTTGNGRVQEGHSNTSSNPPGFEVGEAVPVRYAPANPRDARIMTFGQTWGLTVGFGIASCVTWLVWLFFQWRVVKRLARAARYQRINSLDEVYLGLRPRLVYAGPLALRAGAEAGSSLCSE